MDTVLIVARFEYFHRLHDFEELAVVMTDCSGPESERSCESCATLLVAK